MINRFDIVHGREGEVAMYKFLHMEEILKQERPMPETSRKVRFVHHEGKEEK